MEKSYNPEEYWTKVGKRIKERENGENVIAGDDEPFYRYKRKRFLELLNGVDITDKSILEIGNGPGGNLLELSRKNKAKKLTGVDISDEMVALARKKLPEDIDIHKINGVELPFEDKTFDIVFTATVLQHNTDETMLKKIMKELSRVSADKVYLFERLEQKIKGDELCMGRPVSYYNEIMKENGFKLISKEHINIRASYYVCGVIRKGLNPSSRQEGEPLNKLSVSLQNITLPVTRILDKIFKSNNDVARMEYERIK